MAGPPALELVDVRRHYGSVAAVDGITLSVDRGEFLTLLGPSGSGKTSTLRLIGGFERPDGGSIRINGERIEHLPPYARDTATIFQSGALFPHKTVSENIAYGLSVRSVPAARATERIRNVLSIVRMSGFENRYPGELSGGQKQRVALARSLAVQPAILLFDEPLSALDLSLRLQLRADIRRLHQELGFTAIFVTHDQSEAMAMSDRIAVMNRGRIEQIAAPAEIYSRPVNEFVFTFIGESCCLPLRSDGGRVFDPGGAPIEIALEQPPPPGDVRMYVRPTRFCVGAASAGCANRCSASVHFVEFLGETHRYHFREGPLEFFADTTTRADFSVGDRVAVGWHSADMAVFR